MRILADDIVEEICDRTSTDRIEQVRTQGRSYQQPPRCVAQEALEVLPDGAPSSDQE